MRVRISLKLSDILNMDQAYKVVALTLIALATSNFPITTVDASNSQISMLPAKKFIVLLTSYEEYNLTTGCSFAIGIFSYDENGAQTSGFNGDLFLSVTGGSITPSTVTLSKGFWMGRVVVNATGSVVITAQDNAGHSGSSHNLTIYAPSTTQTPNNTPTVPEITLQSILPLLVVIPLIMIVLARKNRLAS